MESLLAYLLVCLIAVQATYGCRCGIIEENDRYCNADFALIGQVRSEKTLGDEKQYKVRVIRQLKGLQSGYRRIVTIHTTTIPSLCGADLDRKATYLLAGHKRDQELHLSVCKIVRRMTWKEAFSYLPPTCFT